MDRHEFEKKTVTELREMAEQYEDIVGAAGMDKHKLQAVLAEKLGIDLVDHVRAGIGRAKLKARIKELRAARDQALSSGDKDTVRRIRQQLKHNRRHLRKVIAEALREEKRRPEAAS